MGRACFDIDRLASEGIAVTLRAAYLPVGAITDADLELKVRGTRWRG